MFTLNNILGNARSAIFAHQMGVQVASHNISNASTEGYTRQRMELTPGYPMRTAIGPLGTGVRVQDVTRLRDTLLDAAYRRDTGQAAGQGMRRDLLGQVEGVLNDLSGGGIGTALDKFWSSWSDLSNQPQSDAARAAVRQQGAELVATIRRAAQGVEATGASARTRLDRSLSQMSDLASQVGNLNEEIVAQEVTGRTAADLRDLRDRLIDQMAGIGTVRVTERKDGSVSVFLENVMLVDGGSSRAVTSVATAGGVEVQVSGVPISWGAESSVLKELTRVINTDVPALNDQLNGLARSLITEVNALHRQGWTAEGEAITGEGPAGSLIDFFDADPSKASALSLDLSAEVKASAGVIAASGVQNGPGDNSIALKLAALRETAVDITAGGVTTSRTLGAYHRGIVSGVALEISAAENTAVVHQTLADQAATRRQSVSGVSIDEELIRMMQHQQAYAAASRVVTTVDEMMNTLLNMV